MSKNSLFYYDGPSRSVRELDVDLREDRVWAKGVICSPLTVVGRVLCGHVEGVFEIPAPGISPRVVSLERGGPITAIAADDQRAIWVTDVGENRLAVRSAPLPPLGWVGSAPPP